MPRLRVVDLESNEISSLVECEFLQCCPSLQFLTLLGNPGSIVTDYREQIHAMLPQLRYLDEKRIEEKVEEMKPVSLWMPLDKIEKGEKCNVKPKSSEKASRNEAVSEMLLDVAEMRPPTARAHPQSRMLQVLGSWAPGKKSNAKVIVTPKLARPLSRLLDQI
jgi:hypothetical protein